MFLNCHCSYQMMIIYLVRLDQKDREMKINCKVIRKIQNYKLWKTDFKKDRKDDLLI